MGPELFRPERFDFEDNRPTKSSDCYSFGMVVYEVLSGRVPFFGYNTYIVIKKVLEGERPVRPRGAEGRWFTDGIWSILEHCWKANPGDRPEVEDVLHSLEEVSKSWTPPPPQALAGPHTGDSESSTEWSTDEVEVTSESQMVPLRRRKLSEGDPNKSAI